MAFHYTTVPSNGTPLKHGTVHLMLERVASKGGRCVGDSTVSRVAGARSPCM